MLWYFLADRRYLFVLPRAVCLLLHPGITAGISEHALMRKKRTFIQAVNCAHSEADMPPQMRFAHEHVKGVDTLGHKYHALNPDTFHCQHSAYVESLFVMFNTFIRPLDADEHEQLYQQCCAWYRRYGVSARPMPATWPEFADHFEDFCRTQLAAGPHFEPFREQIFAPTDWWVRAVLHSAIRALQHPRVRELTDINVDAADRWSLRQFVRMSQLSALTPGRHWNAEARAALRTGARRQPTTPLSTTRA